MSYGFQDTRGKDTPERARRQPWAVGAALILTVPVVWLIAVSVDTAALVTGWEAVRTHPGQLGLAIAAFGSAFLLRSVAWTRVLPDLPARHAWAGLHVALGGNHVLPLRLGEPLRIASVVRRAGIDWPRATASTLTLRAADLLSIALIALVGGNALVGSWWLTAAVVVVGGVLVGIGLVWLGRLRDVVLPGPVAVGATVAAWGFEAVVVHLAAGWIGVDIGFDGAVLVTAAAVVAQVAAFAPGGIGTYEAGGVGAMVMLGVDPPTALAVVLTAHAVKTAYSLVLGLVAVFVPGPGMLGRIRLRRSSDRDVEDDRRAGAERPVVLFMPALNEEDTVGSVVRRVPTRVGAHPVRCLVVDDGSTDRTAIEAESAGAEVIRLGRNRGLGAAVRVGLESSLRHDPVAVAFCDADGEYAPEELERLVEPILSARADYVVGSRFAGDIDRMFPTRRFGNIVLTWLLSFVARRAIGDGQSGYRAFSPRAAASAEVIHDFNYAQIITLDLLAKGMRYAEVPISYSFRTTGESFVKLGPYLRAVIPAVYREVNAG